MAARTTRLSDFEIKAAKNIDKARPVRALSYLRLVE